jgi:hypothetical protein
MEGRLISSPDGEEVRKDGSMNEKRNDAFTSYE